MSVDPTTGPSYEYSDIDAVPAPEFAGDEGFERPMNPDGSDLGPMYLSPDARRWVKTEVIDRGYVIDWGTREIYDPETDRVIGPVPSDVPRMT